MTVTAPTAPAKPTLPIPPAMPAASSTGTDGTSGTAPTGQTASPEFVGAVRKMESLGAALQGKPAAKQEDAAAGKAAVAANAEAKPEKNQNLPLAAGDSTEAAATGAPQTGVQAPAAAAKPASISYMPFVGIVVLVAVGLTAMRFFKQRQRKPKTALPQRAATGQHALDITAAPDDAAKKKKSRFEVRI